MRGAEPELLRKTTTIKKLVMAKLVQTPILRYVLPHSKKALRFLHFPGEIRTQIYNELIYLARSDGSLNGVHSLRLVSHQIKHELDYELVQTSIAQVKEAVRAKLENPLGYIAPTNTRRPRHEFWSPTQPLLVMDPVPKTYPDSQNLQLTTFVSDLHSPSAMHHEELGFFHALPPTVRRVTITLAIPPHIHDSRVALSAINALSVCLTHALAWLALTNHGHDAALAAKSGVSLVEVRFPLILQCTAEWYWKILTRLAKRSGMDMWQVKNHCGMVTGVAFRLVGVRSLLRPVQLEGRLKEAWRKARERVRE